MSKGLLYLAGGLAQGAGDALLEKAKAKRAERLRELESNLAMRRDKAQHGMAMERQKDDQGFRAAEGARDRQHQSGMLGARNAHDRAMQENRQAFAGDQNELNRQHQSDLASRSLSNSEVMIDHEGRLLVRSGDNPSQAVPLTGPDGQPIQTKRPRQPGEMTDDQQLSAIIKINTREEYVKIDPLGDPVKIEVVDWAAAAADLRRAGMTEYAEMAERQAQQDGSPGTGSAAAAGATGGASPSTAETVSPERPAGLPADARWSPAKGAWVVQRNGQWFALQTD